ncbi:WD repeat-containing protein 70-like [Watersipora subatra]|uniref:WD repeat-containing protein 70-like n=1 Tax=Watersipora subatra TaxID=2589382 RepID=UPI00355C624D
MAGKETRNFDFMAMFEEARKTAVERNHDKVATLEEQYRKSVEDAAKRKSQPDQSTGSSSDTLVGPPVPANLKMKSHDAETSESEEVVGPMPPASLSSTVSQNPKTNEEDELEEEAEETLDQKIPMTNEVVMRHGVKTVSALALDVAGARLVTGSFDYDVKLWDFAGMDSSLQSFRKCTPCESHAIHSIEYSCTGENILVVGANAQAKVLDRDGFEVMECKKGYQYIVDQASTQGHTAMLNCGCWNPKVKNEFMTCSNDGTVRLWTVDSIKHRHLVKPRTSVGKKNIPTTCAFSKDGKLIAAACQDGSIQMWDYKRYVNVAKVCRKAHTNGSDTSCLSFSYDGLSVASRGGDDTVKVWDVRKLVEPVAVAANLFNKFLMTDCCFSPDDKMVMTGTSLNRGETEGKLVFLERNSLQRIMESTVSDSHVVRCLWHPRLNQIVIGTGDGLSKLFYDPEKSHRGAKLCVVKTERKKNDVQFVKNQRIITPYALKMFREDREMSTKKQAEKARKDPVKSHAPLKPISGSIGVDGRVMAHGSTLSQYVAKQIATRKPDERDQDPRAAILRHAENAAKDPYWSGHAYDKTQPVTILQEEEKSDEEDDVPVWKKPKI